jgi:hypothetical protein
MFWVFNPMEVRSSNDERRKNVFIVTFILPMAFWLFLEDCFVASLLAKSFFTLYNPVKTVSIGLNPKHVTRNSSHCNTTTLHHNFLTLKLINS